MWSRRNSVEMPKPTTHASKLMQTRRNVSALMWRISHAPSGTPTIRLGRIAGVSARLSMVNKPA